MASFIKPFNVGFESVVTSFEVKLRHQTHGTSSRSKLCSIINGAKEEEKIGTFVPRRLPFVHLYLYVIIYLEEKYGKQVILLH